MTTIKVNGSNVKVLNFQGNSYAFVPTYRLSWREVHNQAETLFFEGVNGHLATITSEKENAFIKDKILPLSERYNRPDVAYIGGTDEKIEGKWRWITGEKWNYSDWLEGEPNNSTASYDSLVIGNTGWYDWPPTSPTTGINGYIIEFEGTGTPDDILVGTDKNDKIDGKNGDDNIIGRKGNDSLIGGTGEDILMGKAGNDKLDGGEDDDILIGGKGNDIYTVDSLGDVVIERPKQGKDLVKSSVNYNLDNNIENLTLTGKNDLKGTGNNSKNTIRGNRGDNRLEGEGGNDKLIGSGGNDTLVGGPGNDILTGGSGVDYFIFESPKDGVDRINDFNSSNEIIFIDSAKFNGLKRGKLSANQFSIGLEGAEATTPNQRFIYGIDGSLFFDPDGTGSIEQTKIATFSNPPLLSHNNFEIF